MTLKKELVYPFFLEVCAFILEKKGGDFFWESIFHDLAFGKCPHGTYIRSFATHSTHTDSLCCSYKGKEFSYRLERKEPDILFDEISHLLKTNIGILSQKEKNKKRINFHEFEKTIKESRKVWQTIKKKNVKDDLYEKYVIDMKKKHNLNMKDTKYLLSLIMTAISFKTISSKDIEYDDDRIVNIKNIIIENGEIKLKNSLTNEGNKNLFSEEKTDKTVYMRDNWKRYIRDLSKIEESENVVSA